MDWSGILNEVAREIEPRRGAGRVATYIPALARVDPMKFALAAADVDGSDAGVGDADEAFSIQSVSKVFTLTLALGRHGEALFERVGREPSGSAFNSIVQLEHERGIPRNPFINAGALVVTDALIEGRSVEDAVAEIVRFLRDLSGDETVAVDEEVAASEARTGFRNHALANFMKSFGVLRNPVGDVLEVYFRQCSIAISARSLARAALYLANEGADPPGDRIVVAPALARRIAAIMLTCGHYDASGDFAYRVGLPGKSGVGGGIVAIVPGRAALAAWSPGLNAQGNSLVGSLALERLAARARLSVF